MVARVKQLDQGDMSLSSTPCTQDCSAITISLSLVFKLVEYEATSTMHMRSHHKYWQKSGPSKTGPAVVLAMGLPHSKLLDIIWVCIMGPLLSIVCGPIIIPPSVDTTTTMAQPQPSTSAATRMEDTLLQLTHPVHPL